MIFCLMGRGASGKDTLYNSLLEEYKGLVAPIVLYTTRPMRPGEVDGVTYHFVTLAAMQEFETANKIFEKRSYDVIVDNKPAVFNYFTCIENISDSQDYFIICTPDVFEKFCNYYGSDKVSGIYLDVSSAERRNRMTLRELNLPKSNRNFEELDRRVKADDLVYQFDELKLKSNVSVIYADSLSPEQVLEAAKFLVDAERVKSA